MSFFVETLVGGLLAGVMYSLVAIGFVLVYKASGVFNFAQGSMVLCAALTFVTLRETEYRLLACRPAHARDHGRDCDRRRARRAASSGQPAADHAVHGDARAFVRDRGTGPDRDGGQRPRARSRHRRYADQIRRHPGQPVRFGRGGHRRRPGRRAIASSSTRPASASRFAPSPTTRRRRCRSASGCKPSGRSSGASPASSLWSPACCGDRARVCSLR